MTSDATHPAPAAAVASSPRYSIDCKLGSGSYGCVYRVHDHLKGGVVAAKVLEEEVWIPVSELHEEEEETTVSEMALRELSFLKLITDAKVPHVTRLLDFSFELGEHCAPVAYLPLFSGGDLSDAIEEARLGASERLSIGVDVLTAVAHLHAHRPPILHRDIKPENVLLTEKKRGVLADFGFACFEGQPAEPPADEEERLARRRRRRKGGSQNLSHSGVLGTACYIAPEVLRRADQHRSRDAWSLGVLLLELAENRRLDADRDAEAYEEIRGRLAAREAQHGVHWRIIRSFLRRRASKRSSASEALSELRRQGVKGAEKPPAPQPPMGPRPQAVELDPRIRVLCSEVLQTGVPETPEAATLLARLCPEVSKSAVSAVAAKVHEHRCKSDEDMARRLGLTIDDLEGAQETLLKSTGGCLLVPHLLQKLNSFPRR